MYSSARSDTTQFVIAIGRDETGARSTLSLHLIGESDDPLIVAGELRAAVRAGRAEKRCTSIAERVARNADRNELATIEIASERHRTVDATLGRESLVDREVHATCPVKPS